MKPLPCPRCGNTDIIETFCSKCLRELYPLIDKIKEQNISVCIRSKDVKVTHAWESIPLGEAITKAIEKSLTPRTGAIIENIEVMPPEVDFLEKPGIKRTVIVPVNIIGKANAEMPRTYTEQYDIPLIIETTISPKYSKIGTQYFEGTLQVRNETPQRKEKLKSIVKRFTQTGFAINKSIEHKNGTDYEVTDKQRMHQLANELHGQFGGILKETRTLVTRDKQRSRDVFRDTVLLEYPPFDKGDVIIDEKRVLQVVQLGRKIRYTNVLTGKRVEEPYKQDTFTIIEPQEVQVSQLHPTPAIISPETYQQTPLYAAGPMVGEVGDQVSVIKHQDKWWLVR